MNEHEKDSNRDEAVEPWLHGEVRAASAAQGEIDQAEVLRLSRVEQEAFAAALLAPPEPNEALDRAYERRSRLLGRSLGCSGNE